MLAVVEGAVGAYRSQLGDAATLDELVAANSSRRLIARSTSTGDDDPPAGLNAVEFISLVVNAVLICLLHLWVAWVVATKHSARAVYGHTFPMAMHEADTTTVIINDTYHGRRGSATVGAQLVEDITEGVTDVFSSDAKKRHRLERTSVSDLAEKLESIRVQAMQEQQSRRDSIRVQAIEELQSRRSETQQTQFVAVLPASVPEGTDDADVASDPPP